MEKKAFSAIFAEGENKKFNRRAKGKLFARFPFEKHP
jgi:hypothetical protein